MPLIRTDTFIEDDNELSVNGTTLLLHYAGRRAKTWIWVVQLMQMFSTTRGDPKYTALVGSDTKSKYDHADEG